MYTLIALGLGAAATLFVLWRKARVEKERDVLKLLLENSGKVVDAVTKAVIDNAKFYADQDARKEAVITQLRKEIEALNDVLEKLPTGSVLDGLRAQIGIKESDLIDPNKE